MALDSWFLALSKMRKLLKVILPPLVGFAAYFLAVRYSSVYFSLRIDEMGEGTIMAFMAYFRFFMPLLFVVAILTQLLIVVPVWDRVFLKSKTGKFVSSLILYLICLFFAAGARQVATGYGRAKRTKEKLFVTSMCIGSGMVRIPSSVSLASVY